MIEIKNIILEMRNSLDELISRLNTTEKRIRELENGFIEII